MDQDTLWKEGEDQDLDDTLKCQVEAPLDDPAFLAWMDQQETRLLSLQALLIHPSPAR